MENPKYKFYLSGSFAAREAFPVYADSFAIDFSKESGQEFFRTKVNGKLKFIGGDYDDIIADPISTKFLLTIEDANGSTIFEGFFYKTDCEIDENDKIVEVAPTPDDEYADILAGWEREYNLIKLAPEINQIDMMRRPVIQVYNRLAGKVTCILSGMCWEQDCDPVSDPQNYGFALMSPGPTTWNILMSTFPGDFDDWAGEAPVPSLFHFNIADPNDESDTIDGYYVKVVPSLDYVTIRRAGDDSIFAQGFADGQLSWPDTITLLISDNSSPLYGKHIVLEGQPIGLYCRLLCDKSQVLGQNTQDVRSDDFVGKIPGYPKMVGYNPGGINQVYIIQEQMSATPTDEGRSLGGNYYIKPTFPPTSGYGAILPLCRSIWDEFSIWWTSSPLDPLMEEDGRTPFTLRDAYPLHSVIQVLLNEMGSSVTFDADEAYSDFLYAAWNTIKAASFDLFLTPKSNLTAFDYEQAAQRGNITLKHVFDMLRDCFRCYWFIDGGKLRIEHIEYFRRGGSYVNPPTVGIDLTDLYYSRTGKTIATAQQAYKFEKPETYARIVFGWMDDCTAPFDGSPIEILSPWVQKDKSESVDVTNFTSDLDYIILNPGDISKDGFALLCAQEVNGRWVVPFINFYQNGTTTPSELGEVAELVLQNGYLSFKWLQRYYLYDLAAPNYSIDGRNGTAIGTKLIKTQEVEFPAQYAPNLQQLIKTLIGNGQIQKLSINLSSLNCKATLNYGVA